MSTENSNDAHSLDEEMKATDEHDQVRDDHSQEENLLERSTSHVGQGFLVNGLDLSSLTHSIEDSDDESRTGTNSLTQESSDTVAHFLLRSKVIQMD
jgi:hypothetical protein